MAIPLNQAIDNLEQALCGSGEQSDEVEMCKACLALFRGVLGYAPRWQVKFALAFLLEHLTEMGLMVDR